MKFNDGDKVQVKYFKDMAEQYGVANDGCIYMPSYMRFEREMKKFCGEIYTIEKVYKTEYTYELLGISEYWFTDEMLEPVYESAQTEEPKKYKRRKKNDEQSKAEIS